MDVVLIGRNELPLAGNYAYSKASVSSVGHVKTDGQIVDVNGESIAVDTITRALVGIDYAHHEIHSGSHFFIDFGIDLLAQDWIDIRFKTPDSLKLAHMLINVRSQEEGLYQLYETAPILNTGTSMIAFNSNRNSIKTSGVTDIDYIINTTESNANLDTDITGATRLRNGLLGSNQGNVSGESRNDNEMVLKSNISYLIRLNNRVSSTRYFSWVLDWYEQTSKV